MSDIIGTLRRRAPRYEIKNDGGLIATIDRDDATCASIEVKLLNISVGGARIKVSENIVAKEVLALRIQTEHPRRRIAVSGEVCWVRPAAGDDWTFGCKFDPPIPEEVLHEFALADIVERREHRREQVSPLPAMAMWERQSGSTSVWINDLSRGGFCLESPVSGKPGERTLLQLGFEDQPTATIPGKIRWCVESQDGYVIGCEFVNYQDFNVLCRLTDAKPHGTAIGQPISLRSRFNRSFRLAAIGAASLLCVVIFGRLTLLTDEDQSSNPPDQTVARPEASEPGVRNQETYPSSDEAAADLAKSGNVSVQNTVDPAIATITKRPKETGDTQHQNLSNAAPAANAHTGPADTGLLSTLVDSKLRTIESKKGTLQADAYPEPTVAHVEEPAIKIGNLADAAPAAPPSKVWGDALDTDITRQPNGVTANVTRHREKATANVVRRTDNSDTTGASQAEFRTWTDDTGRYRVVARLVIVEGNTVRLQKKNGRFALVPLHRLSKVDLRHIQRFLVAVE